VRDGRAGGAITSAIEALFLLGNDAFFTGQWEQVTEVTEEGLMLCQTHDYRLLAWPGMFLQALLAAARGDHPGRLRPLTDRRLVMTRCCLAAVVRGRVLMWLLVRAGGGSDDLNACLPRRRGYGPGGPRGDHPGRGGGPWL
jgi:hypothetical protein